MNQVRWRKRPPLTIKEVGGKPKTCPECEGELRKTAYGFRPSGHHCWNCNIVWTVKRNGFKRGSGQYRCEECGKETRDTGASEGTLRLCRSCLERLEEENAEADR